MNRAAIRFGIGLIATAFLLPVPAAAQARCGGTERWQVKVGTDSGNGRVDLTAQIPISLQDLISLPEPARPPRGDNDTRLDAETHVYVVRARLMVFKLETGSTGDQDYHLAVSDDTLAVTRDSAGVPPGHSFVAEIPNPDCIPGKHGDPSVPSRFADSIRQARQKLESQFPGLDTTGAFNDAGGIPVQITGIGFFDFPHHQVGRAPNNIELHPILDIVFSPPPGSFTLSASPTTLSVPVGGSGATTLTTSVSGGFNSDVALALTSLPTGATFSFSTTSIAAPGAGSATLSINVDSNTTPRTYNLTVSGSAAGTTQSAALSLIVTSTAALSVSLSSPLDGSTATGLVNISASGSSGVAKLELYIDDVLKAWNIGATSIAYPWDTTATTNRPHTILSKAYDASGAVVSSSPVTVSVSN